MGSYGIGPGRIMAAAVEQLHDENGIVWPAAIAPYDVHVVVLPGAEEIGLQAAEALSAAGPDVLLDDRELRAGREVRRRRPDRLPDARHGRARRPSRTARSTSATVRPATRSG